MHQANVPLHRHKAPHRELARRYRHAASQQRFRTSVVSSIALFVASVIFSFFAIGYANEHASNYATDIVLSNIPVYNVGALFVGGSVFLVVFVVALLLAHPKRIPYTLHALTLFYVIRSCFTMLTHLGPFPQQVDDSTYNLGIVFGRFLFGNDYFFSAHTGVCFLLALVFWREPGLRFSFLFLSVYMAIVVLLGHLHYSIDVAAAFFITYAIHSIAEWLFPKDRQLFYTELLPE